MISAAHKRNNVKWDRENMRSLSCRVRKEQSDAFKAWCSANNTTPGKILKEFVLEIINEEAEKQEGKE